MGEAGGEKSRNPYPNSSDIDQIMAIYRIMRGEKP
jgi:hypothetical protein